MDLQQVASYLRDARMNRTAVAPLSDGPKPIELNDAYRIQDLGLELELASGRNLAGYKMGLTSRAKQEDVKVFEPIRGYLLSDMQYAEATEIDTSRFIHPRIEPEVAVILSRDFDRTNVTTQEVAEALTFVGPAIELLDSRFKDFSFRLSDVVADNTSAAGFLIGSQNWVSEVTKVPLFGVVVRKNGEIIETGAPASVLGNPLNSVVSLIQSLARDGRKLAAGQVVLTGGITASVPVASGDVIQIEWPRTEMRVRFT